LHQTTINQHHQRRSPRLYAEAGAVCQKGERGEAKGENVLQLLTKGNMHHHHQNASKFVTIYHNQPKEEARLYAEAGFLCWWCAIILNRLNLVVFCAVCL
jgi:hypothetical protein